MLLLALWGCSLLCTPNLRTTPAFLSTLGELREASYSDKASHRRTAEPERPSQRPRCADGAPGRPALFPQQRSESFSSSSRPTAIRSQFNRSAYAEGRRIRLRRQPDQDRHEQRFAARAADDRGALRVVESGRSRAAGRGAGNGASRSTRPPWRCCASGSAWKRIPASRRKSPPAWRWPRWTAPMPRRVSQAIATLQPKRQPGCAEQAGALDSTNLPTAASSKATRRCGRPPPPRSKPSTAGAPSIPASRRCFSA